MKRSWKTTITVALTILVAVGGAFLHFLKTGQIPAIEPILAAITAGVGLLFARDNNKSSEDVGAK